MRRQLRSLLALAALGLFPVSCGWFTSQDCDCEDGGFEVLIPDSLAASVQSVTVSGGPCDSLPAGNWCEVDEPADGGGGCTSFDVNVNGGGVCEIAVTFNDGSQFHATTILTSDGFFGVGGGECCEDIYRGANVTVRAAIDP